MTVREVSLEHAARLLQPSPVVLVSVGDGAEDNLFTASWCTVYRDRPPRIALATSRRSYSWDYLSRTGELGVSILGASHADAVLGCGSTSGRREADKYSRFGLTRREAHRIDAPLVQQGVAWVECVVLEVSGDGDAALVLAEVVHAEADDTWFAEGAWRLAPDRRLLHHLDGARFVATGDVVVARYG